MRYSFDDILIGIYSQLLSKQFLGPLRSFASFSCIGINDDKIKDDVKGNPIEK
jgi:hypothetical protein